MHPGLAIRPGEVLGKGSVGYSVTLWTVLQTEGVYRQNIGAFGFEAANQTVYGLQVSAHPVGAIKQDADGGPARLESLSKICRNIRAIRNFRVV